MRSFICGLIFLPLALQAQTKYVDDTLYLGFYKEADGSGSQFSSVPSGTKLTFIESKNGYSLVRTEKGTEGWVKSKYLVDKPPAVVRIKALEQVASRADALAGEVETLSEENTLLRTEIDKLKDKLEGIESNTSAPQPQPVVAPTTTEPVTVVVETIDSQHVASLKLAMSEALMSLKKVTETAQESAGEVTEMTMVEAADIDIETEEPAADDNVGILGMFKDGSQSLLGWESILAELRSTKPLHYILIVIAILSGFGLGLFVLDRRIRKQHGGYRIW